MYSRIGGLGFKDFVSSKVEIRETIDNIVYKHLSQITIPGLPVDKQNLIKETIHNYLVTFFPAILSGDDPADHSALAALAQDAIIRFQHFEGLVGAYRIPHNRSHYREDFFPEQSIYNSLKDNESRQAPTIQHFKITMASQIPQIACKNLLMNFLLYRHHLYVTIYGTVLRQFKGTREERMAFNNEFEDLKNNVRYSAQATRYQISSAVAILANSHSTAQNTDAMDNLSNQPLLLRKLHLVNSIIQGLQNELHAKSENSELKLDEDIIGKIEEARKTITAERRPIVDSVSKMFQPIKSDGAALYQHFDQLLSALKEIKNRFNLNTDTPQINTAK